MSHSGMRHTIRTTLLIHRQPPLTRIFSTAKFFCQQNILPHRNFITTTTNMFVKVDKIPLNGIPFLPSLSLSVLPTKAFANVKSDLFVAAVRATAAGNDDVATEKKILVQVPEIYQNEILSRAIDKFEFTGVEAKTLHVTVPLGHCFCDVAVLGLGKNNANGISILDGYAKEYIGHISGYTAQNCGKSLSEKLIAVKASSLTLGISVADVCPEGLQRMMESMFFHLTSPDTRFKSKPVPNPVNLNSVNILIDDVKRSSEYSAALDKAKYCAAGIQFTRELVQAPPNICNTESLAAAARSLAEESGLACRIYNEKECRDMRMGAYLAVHQGSAFDAQFIHLTYNPKGPVKKKLVLIGKGLCTDTGGYNLKVSCGIEIMKCDMGGAGAVLGAAKIISAMKPEEVEVHFIIAAAENMISAEAFRPGDVLTAGNGTTIEVGNTDAEGRLTLCDALVYAEREVKPDYMLDCATLTGAIMQGLGDSLGGLYSTDNKFMNIVLRSAKATGTPIWPMPLVQEYRTLIDSNVADLNNVASCRTGGSITAALFLKEFVKTTPWCHLDLAGPAFNSKKEATGYGATLLAEVAMNIVEK